MWAMVKVVFILQTNDSKNENKHHAIHLRQLMIII